ncbi:zinc metalloprotease HtpX [Corallococcus exiguus]|uniref:Protease HtpX homolog n=1 Tax=Corallococcus exiguus TaxID=83462 RepID=A0A7Y1WMF1_9BACT|nr:MULTISPECIES: zinc metalloprotease HtpX [Corallococcus]RKI45817.1 protease HtpX [Corallococcus sp. AB004]NBC41993.1 M48 family metalloprotease [Corallococcus exiguus]NNB86219.1 zinc metalloprotease HtpX [Corallococcus exiguus]NNB94730.1 zinc metalloprotease HtpX [Corallococcus exiguus]NNC03303.1 zinc metalloprotease HtpX [Corallococcus exiguus]
MTTRGPAAPALKGGGWHRLGNALKTTVLLAGLTALVLVIGQRLGGAQGLMMAGLFAVVMNFGSYWFSDRIALAIHGAQPLSYEQAPWLHEMVERLAARAGMPKPKVYLLPTAQPNAFATGRNPSHAAVAVTAGIMDILDRRELEGVLAHEIGHVRNRDTLIGTVAATLAGIISYAAQMLFWFGGSMLSRGDDDRDGGVAGALSNLGLLLVAPIAATLLQLAVSRSREYGADATGAELCGDPDALASALLKMERGAEAMPYDRAPATSHLFIVNPLHHGGVMSLFSTHPPIPERVRRLREMSARMGQGTRGRGGWEYAY